MMQWLESDLAMNTQPWVIAFWHHPPYTKGSHNSDSTTDSGGRMFDMREIALPILEAWGVDLVMNGHSHSYERSYLLDAHYGISTALGPVTNVLNPGDGKETGDGMYQKPNSVASPNAGAVYAVAGSSGKTSGGALNHPAMYVSLNSLGSLVIDVSGNRLDAWFIDDDAAVMDEFSIIKVPDSEPPLISAAAGEDANHVLVDFNEALDPTEATNAANYTIEGLGVIQAELLTGNRRVRLTTSTMNNGSSHTLVVNNVQDVIGNTILPDSQIEFDFHELFMVAFQDGQLPDVSYDGTRDAYIREASADTAHGTETSLQVDGAEPSGSTTDMYIVLGWDISAIPTNATVESAEIQFVVTNPSGGPYDCFSLLTGWDQAQVTWNSAFTGVPWGTPGAASPSDRGSQIVCSVTAGSTGPMTVSLVGGGLALVQSWVGNPAGNHGIVIGDPSTTNTNGADFHASESSTADARPRLNVTYRVPGGLIEDHDIGNSPSADYVSDCIGPDCSFTDLSSDSDGMLIAWSWDFGDGVTSHEQHPAHHFDAAGEYIVSLTVTDDDFDTDSVRDIISVSEPPLYADHYAEADLPTAGRIHGRFSNTHGDDGSVQAITEREGSGKPDLRYSYLSHTWQFTVTPGDTVTLHANAWSGGSSDGDAFVFAWSSDGKTFRDLFTVEGGNPSNVESGVIAASGTLYIRVSDTDRTPSHRELNSIYVDQLYIRSESSGGSQQPATPMTLTANGYKIRGIQHVDLAWGGAASDQVDIIRDGAAIATVANDGAYEDKPGNRGSRTYVYRVCEAGAENCSGSVNVKF
jgi:PKD repeat protein